MSTDNLITSFATRYQLERNRRPFKRRQVRELPKDRYGVYALWIPGEIDDAYTCLYIGLSVTCVRRRLLDHLSYEENPELRQQLRMFEDLVTFSVAFTENEAETNLLETSVIQDLQPLTNRNKLGFRIFSFKNKRNLRKKLFARDTKILYNSWARIFW